MSSLSKLRPSPGSTKNRKRVGRGPGSGHGKQAGVGGKGQKGSSGYKSRAWSEGGQMPLQRRLPKRGFYNKFRIDYQEINISDLIKLNVPEITPETLKNNGLLRRRKLPVKILGDGEIDRAISVTAHAFSASAREKIEKAGGKVKIVSRDTKKNSDASGGIKPGE
jgi:large subunit ribosomal protein L15